jgi:putative DNA primase/helicase
VALYRDRLRYCHGAGSWYEWDGSLWRQHRTRLAFQFARELARQLSRGRSIKTCCIAQSTKFATGVERFASCDPALAATADWWDSDPMLLGTPAGTVDLRTGLLRPGNPADGITKATAIAPADGDDCPLWHRFLEEVTGGDQAMIRFLQQWAGYALTGLTHEHALVFIFGPGRNGKSVLLNVLTGILGSYAVTAAMDTFTAAGSGKHTTDLAILKGARLVTSSETEEGQAWAESRIKQMTGGDPITARFMRRDPFTFLPQFKLTITGNYQPVLRNVGEATRRRFNIIPFTRTPEAPDQHLEEKLRAEWPGILRWMIEGCLDWQQNGLVRPQSVQEASNEYFSEQDVLGQWLAEECEVDPSKSYMQETTSALYQAWSTYAQRSGETPGSKRAFTDRLKQRGLVPFRHSFARGFQGIRLRSPYPNKMTDDA